MSLQAAVASRRDDEREWHDEHYREVRHPLALAEFLDHHRAIFAEPYWRHLHPGGVWCESLQRALEIAAPNGWRSLRVLDVGSGTGYLSLWLANLGAQVVGVELSPVGAAIAREAAKRYGLSASFHGTSVEDIPEPAESFDIAIGLGVLHHIVKYPSTAVEIARVLKPNARAIFSESWHENAVANWLRDRKQRFEKEAGDERLSLETIRHWAREALFVERIEPRAILYGVKAWIQNRAILRTTQFIDLALLRLPLARRLATEAVVVLRKAGTESRPRSCE